MIMTGLSKTSISSRKKDLDRSMNMDTEWFSQHSIAISKRATPGMYGAFIRAYTKGNRTRGCQILLQTPYIAIKQSNHKTAAQPDTRRDSY